MPTKAPVKKPAKGEPLFDLEQLGEMSWHAEVVANCLHVHALDSGLHFRLPPEAVRAIGQALAHERARRGS